MFGRELATVGAATGGAAALPGAGFGTAIALGGADLSWFTVRAADLILTVAAIHGHTESSVEERRAWVLSILAFGGAASQAFDRLARDAGKGLGRRATERVSAEILRRVDRALGRTVVTKYGTKRGVLALGRAFPFGIGALIGGSGNLVMARGLARQADTFFRLLPPRGVA